MNIVCANCGARVERAALRAHLNTTECAERAAQVQAVRKAALDRAAELAAIEAARIQRVPPGVSGADPSTIARGRFNRMEWTCRVCGDEMFAGQRKAHEADGCEPPSPGRSAAVRAAIATEARA